MFKKRLLSLWIILLIAMSCSAAVAELYPGGTKIEQVMVEDVPYYVVCSMDGKWLHDPVPFPITIASDNEDGDSESLVLAIDEVGLAIYHKKTGWFSGFIYQEVHVFSEGLCAVSTDKELFGYINAYGETVIPLRWEWTEDFQNGIALVTYETANGYKNVWINTEGEIISLDPDYGYDIQDQVAE